MSEPSREPSKEEYEALARFRYTLRRFLRFAEQEARNVGLTPQQHQLLLAVKGQPGRAWASITDVAEWLQIRHHAAVGLVDRCARAGLARREQHPADRRQVRVVLTDEGERLLAMLSHRNLHELRMLQGALLVAEVEAGAEPAEGP